MKKSEIKVGGLYIAKVSGKLTTVRVDDVREVTKFRGTGYDGHPTYRSAIVYDVTNLSTKRKTTFQSAAKFRWEAKPKATPTAPVKTPAKAPVKVEAPVKPSLTKALQHSDAPHVVVRAYAGTGKTFSLIVGCAWAYARNRWKEVVEGLGFDPQPSDEQQAIWNALAADRPRTITYTAFNKSIVTEFTDKWGWLVSLLSQEGISLSFATINSLGYKSCLQAYGRCNTTDRHTANTLAGIMGVNVRELYWKHLEVAKAIEAIVEKAKLTLTGWSPDGGFEPDLVDVKAIEDLASHFDIDLNGNQSTIYSYVPRVLAEHARPNGELDFNDQNWLPVINRLAIPKQDLLLVDEGQDLPRCKAEFCRRMGKRFVLVGDTHQAIYGFAGADTESIPRIQSSLADDPQGVTELRLTQTRRCGKAIVREAQQYVEDFSAHEDNPEGVVKTMKQKDYLKVLEDNDMVLSRVNAPLVSNALKLIKSGRKAVVRGRDFGGQLIKFIDGLKAGSVAELLEKASDWLAREEDKESRKRNPSEAKVQSLHDRYEVICVFAEDATTVAEVVSRVNLVFAGKECPICHVHYNEEQSYCTNKGCKMEEGPNGYPVGAKLITPKGVQFSSIHKAKGLEADRVFILRTKDAPMPHPMAKTKWAKSQEYNLLYVAITRAINQLTYVVDAT